MNKLFKIINPILALSALALSCISVFNGDTTYAIYWLVFSLIFDVADLKDTFTNHTNK